MVRPPDNDAEVEEAVYGISSTLMKQYLSELNSIKSFPPPVSNSKANLSQSLINQLTILDHPAKMSVINKLRILTTDGGTPIADRKFKQANMDLDNDIEQNKQRLLDIEAELKLIDFRLKEDEKKDHLNRIEEERVGKINRQIRRSTKRPNRHEYRNDDTRTATERNRRPI